MKRGRAKKQAKIGRWAAAPALRRGAFGYRLQGLATLAPGGERLLSIEKPALALQGGSF
jgi:hypothetical protein